MTTKLLLKTYKTQIMNICPSCGNKLTDDQAKFCPRCGTKLKYLLSGEMTFGKAISNFWSNYFNFSGRATPPEFWYKMVKIPNTNFSISKYPITQQEYFDVIKKDPSQFSGDPSLPVENVSWYEAMRFCKTLTVAKRKSGEISQNQEYRLPTSEQWEFACRAGTTTKYCSGNTDKDLSSVAWWGGQTKKTHPVGQKSPNAWGIYDMHGNVWEWCLNAHPRYKTHAIIRGGSYRNGAYYCESSYTDSKDANTRSNNIGFRIILITE